MNDDQLTPEYQALIEKLRTLPEAQLDTSVRQAIRQRLLAEFRAIHVAAPRHTTTYLQKPPRSYRRLVPAILAAALVLVVIGMVVFQLTHQTDNDKQALATLLPTQSPGQIVPTASHTPGLEATAFSTNTAVAPTVESTPFLTDQPLVSSSATALAPSAVPATPVPTVTRVSPTLTLTATLQAVIVVEGPITSITNNVITIYNFAIEVAPQHPILSLINIGDVVFVQGIPNENGVIIAEVVSNISNPIAPDGTAVVTVSLEGPVEKIDQNVITLNGIAVQLAPDSPVLPTLRIGSFISVEGNFEGSGNNIYLVAVNVTVVNNVVISGTPSCWFHDDGMGMGHWHCDGMGMGMGMGMGE